jgi:hypothetical protein
VRVRAAGVQASDVSADVDVSLEQVRVKHSGGSTTVSIGSGNVDGVVGFDSLSEVSGASSGQKVTLRPYGDELVASAGGTEVLGGLQVLVRVAAQPRSLTLTPTALLLGSRELPLAALPSSAGQMLQPRTIALRKLPAGISLTSASVGETGLWISAHIDPMTVALGGSGTGCGSAQ